MAKKCPPGVICIENVTLFFMFCIVLLIAYISLYYFRQYQKKSTSDSDNILIVERNQQPQSSSFGSFFTNPNYLFSTDPRSIFLNPYTPPLKENRFFPPTTSMGDVRGGVPINMRTSHYDMDYRQVGILTAESGKDRILALFGRPLHSNRNKWQYYTMTDKNNAIKLPISRNGRSCTSDMGCDELFNGDNVYVQGYNNVFNATIYENNEPRYIPYL